MKRIHRISLLITIAVLLSLAWQVRPAQSQADIRLDTVKIHLLPEYIQPTVLVIYEIDLDLSIPLPQALRFNLPADAQVLSVINFTSEGRPIELEYQQEQFGKWKLLTLTATTGSFRIEYQDPNLVRQQNQRMYTFLWLSEYPVSTLSANVRRPPGASEIFSQPYLMPLDDLQDEQGVYSASFNDIPAGTLFTLSFSYTLEAEELAYPALDVEPASSFNQRAPGRTPSPISVILWLLVVSVAIIILVGLYYVRFRIKKAEEFEHIGQGVGIMNPERGALFCQECGMRTRVGDTYCSNCGTELRKPTPFEQPPQK